MLNTALMFFTGFWLAWLGAVELTSSFRRHAQDSERRNKAAFTFLLIAGLCFYMGAAGAEMEGHRKWVVPVAIFMFIGALSLARRFSSGLRGRKIMMMLAVGAATIWLSRTGFLDSFGKWFLPVCYGIWCVMEALNSVLNKKRERQ